VAFRSAEGNMWTYEEIEIKGDALKILRKFLQDEEGVGPS